MKSFWNYIKTSSSTNTSTDNSVSNSVGKSFGKSVKSKNIDSETSVAIKCSNDTVNDTKPSKPKPRKLRGNQTRSRLCQEPLLFQVDKHTETICDMIHRYSGSNKFILGCVAWITCPRILKCLLSARSAGSVVSFIINKDDTDCSTDLALLYINLGCISENEMSVLLDTPKKLCYRRRCIVKRDVNKMSNSDIKSFMHHKFAVFGDIQCDSRNTKSLYPSRGCIGSFNWTINARSSAESLLWLTSSEILYHMIHEYRKQFKLA